MSRPPEPVSRRALTPVFTVVKPVLHEGRGALTLAVMGVVGGAIMKLLLPWPMKLLFDFVLPSVHQRPRPAWIPADPETALTLLASALIVLYLVKGWFFYLGEIQSARAGRMLIQKLRSELFSKILRLPQAFHTRRKSGDLLARLVTDVNQIKELVLGVGLGFGGEMLTMIGMLAVLAWHDPFLALASAIVLPVMFIASRRFSSSIRSAARDQRRRQGELVANVNEALRSIRVVQAFDRAKLHQSLFDGRDSGSLRAEVRMRRLQTNLVRAVETGVAVGTALILWMGARKVLSGAITAGDLIVFTSYLKTMYRPLQDLAKLSSRYNKAVASADRISEILDEPEPITDAPGAVPLGRAAGRIEFRNVTFGYEAERPVLKDVSFTLEPGECLALVGPSGAGKSTIGTLLQRFFDPDRGAVLLDGRDIRRYRLGDLRRQVAVVFQDPYLFGMSVRDNIAYGRPGASDAEIETAARSAQAHEFVERLSNGYETIIGEHGCTLSAGQRQRIAIARAIVADAPILILDEPMTGLDTEREREVQDALNTLQKGRTTLLITHNLNDRSGVNRVVRLRRGKLEEPYLPLEFQSSSVSEAAQ